MRRLSVSGMAAILAVSLLVVVPLFLELDDHYFKLPRQARPLLGKSEAEVRVMLGPPQFEYSVSELGGRTLHGSELPYGGSWSPVPDEPVSHRVLVYTRGAKAAFLYVDAQGRVERIQLSGT